MLVLVRVCLVSILQSASNVELVLVSIAPREMRGVVIAVKVLRLLVLPEIVVVERLVEIIIWWHWATAI